MALILLLVGSLIDSSSGAQSGGKITKNQQE